MKLAVEPVDLDSIRRDGQTQVRESLDEAWVEELRSLYEDGHSIDPIVVMRDADGSVWLVDGFHRVEALLRAGLGGTAARVLTGSVEQARFEAAARGKGGMVRNSGDKKRAILMALATEQGRKMGQRELARHCGVAHSYLLKVTGALVSSDQQQKTATMGPKAEKAALRAAAARAALLKDPEASDTEIAKRAGIDIRWVYAERDALGLPSSRERADAKFQRARELWMADPSLTVAAVQSMTGFGNRQRLAALRDELGVPAADSGAGKRGKSSACVEPPSAPQRKHNDPREGADAKVIQLRPAQTKTDPWVVDMLGRFESATLAQRADFVESVERRWPGTFANQPAERSEVK